MAKKHSLVQSQVMKCCYVSGQYSFTSGILENVFINPEIELTMEITRKEAFRDAEKDTTLLTKK